MRKFVGGHCVTLPERKLVDGFDFPLTIVPNGSSASAADLKDFVEGYSILGGVFEGLTGSHNSLCSDLFPVLAYHPPTCESNLCAHSNNQAILQSVAVHGAVLLRGWTGETNAGGMSPPRGATDDIAPWAIGRKSSDDAFPVSHLSSTLAGSNKQIPTAHTFAAAVSALKLGDCDMSCSSAPRKEVAPGVFTANEAPPSEVIPFHHEMAQCPSQPKVISFFCETAPASGGETPILPSCWAARYLNTAFPSVADKLRVKGVKYVRVIPDGDDESSPLGRSWQSTFGVQTREEAEVAIARMDMECEWLPNGDVRTTSKPMPFFVEHNGKELFYNACVAALVGWGDSRNEASKTVTYSDGQPLEPAALDALHDCARYMRHVQVAFSWRAGDMLILDNRTTMHSRATFTPPRRVLAALSGLPKVGLPLPFKAAHAGAELAARVPSLTLRSSDTMPAVGLGTWKIPKEATAAAVHAAIRQGYRHLDCACDYGNEKQVGEGIRMAIAEGLVTREELFIVSKLWNTYHAAEHVKPACLKSLDDLGLDYLDLYLVHFPISLRYVPFEERYPPEWVHDPSCPVPRMELAHVPYHVTWGAMEELQRVGLCRNVGVANLTCHAMRDLLASATIPPAVLQVELHPYLQQQKLLRFCKEQGIVVTGFSPLGAGSYVELSMASESDSVLQEPAVLAMAQKHGKSVAQVVLRWAVQRGTSVIPKSSKPHRLLENLDLFDDKFTLSEEDMAAIGKLDKHRRFNDPGVFCEGMGGAVPIFD